MGTTTSDEAIGKGGFTLFTEELLHLISMNEASFVELVENIWLCEVMWGKIMPTSEKMKKR